MVNKNNLVGLVIEVDKNFLITNNIDDCMFFVLHKKEQRYILLVWMGTCVDYPIYLRYRPVAIIDQLLWNGNHLRGKGSLLFKRADVTSSTKISNKLLLWAFIRKKANSSPIICCELAFLVQNTYQTLKYNICLRILFYTFLFF